MTHVNQDKDSIKESIIKCNWNSEKIYSFFKKDEDMVRAILREHNGYRVFYQLNALISSFINIKFYTEKISECCLNYNNYIISKKDITDINIYKNETIESFSNEINSLFFGYLASVYTYREFSNFFSDKSTNSPYKIKEYSEVTPNFFDDLWCSIIMKTRNALIHGKYITIGPAIGIGLDISDNFEKITMNHKENRGVFILNKNKLLSISQLNDKEKKHINSAHDVLINQIINIHFSCTLKHFEWLKDNITSKNSEDMKEVNNIFRYVSEKSTLTNTQDELHKQIDKDKKKYLQGDYDYLMLEVEFS